MNQNNRLAPHEMLELHEILRNEVTAATKLQTSIALVRDPDLKKFMEASLEAKQGALRQYQNLYDEKARYQ